MNRVGQILDFLMGGVISSREKKLAAVQARYEAAYWSQGRTYLNEQIQSARQDIDQLSRQEVMRRIRYFEKNSPLMLKILSIMDTNVIGSGIAPSSGAADEDWGKAAVDWFMTQFVPVCDVTGTCTAFELQSMSYRGQKVDGASFIALRDTALGRPGLEVIEAHRCGGTVDFKAIEKQGFKYADGIILDQFRRPVVYLIADEFDASKIIPYMASQMVHIFRKKRAGQIHGISDFHASALDLHDLDDLQKYEMRAAKDAAAISRTIESAAGGVTVDGEGIGASLSALPNTDPTQRQKFYREAMAGEVLALQPGDKMEQYESKRPSAATTGFWDRLDNKIVQGAGVSYAALMDYRGNWGGATLRAALQSDNRLFSLETAAQARAWQKIWEYAVGWAISHGELAPNPDWKKVRWHPPRRTTVDVGNDADAMLKELKAGLRTFETTYGENGEDWRERLEQRAVEEAYLMELADKYGVPKADISSFADERLQGQAPDAVAPTPGAPGAPQPGKKKPAGGGNE